MYDRKLTNTILYGILAILCIFLTDTNLVKAGTYNGVNLWLFTIVPTLFPFIFISEMLNYLNGFIPVSKILYPISKSLFKISRNGNYSLIMGYLCGFPMGAKVTSDLLKQKYICKTEAEYLTCITNNLSPGFITGYYCTYILNNKSLFIPSVISIYSGQILCAIILRYTKYKAYSFMDIQIQANSTNSDKKLPKLDIIMKNTFLSLLKIGGYIIIFSILCVYIKALPCNANIKIILTSMAEITSGLNLMTSGNISSISKFIIGTTAISFGGISGIFQTRSIITGCNINIIGYTFTRLLCAIFTLLTAVVILLFI